MRRRNLEGGEVNSDTVEAVVDILPTLSGDEDLLAARGDADGVCLPGSLVYQHPLSIMVKHYLSCNDPQ
jgi:hypothetical protein